MILEKTIKKGSAILKKNNILTHELDAEILLSNIMGVTRESFITNNKIHITENNIRAFDKAIERRGKNEPVAYIIGKKEFWSEDFFVNSKTLIPRPETELLIYKILEYFKNKNINILDIGTGSGCILLSILKELKFSRGIGIDISRKAIQTAIINSKKLNLLNRVKFKLYDINNYNMGKYDLIVSNPPYIPSQDIKNLSKDITKYEPINALDGGVDGLDLIKKVIYKSNFLIKKNGLLSLEIGYQQYKKVSNILKRNGFREISKEYDYNRNVRCIISTKVKFLKF
jgi:release factor glutamine methyltransferase